MAARTWRAIPRRATPGAFTTRRPIRRSNITITADTRRNRRRRSTRRGHITSRADCSRIRTRKRSRYRAAAAMPDWWHAWWATLPRVLDFGNFSWLAVAQPPPYCAEHVGIIVGPDPLILVGLGQRPLF